MKCPKCNQTLVMSERQDVEIDYCPECRGGFFSELFDFGD